MHRIKCKLLKWRKASDILFGKRIPIRLKSKFSKTVVKLAIINGSKCWVIDRKMKHRRNFSEIIL